MLFYVDISPENISKMVELEPYANKITVINQDQENKEDKE